MQAYIRASQTRHSFDAVGKSVVKMLSSILITSYLTNKKQGTHAVTEDTQSLQSFASTTSYTKKLLNTGVICLYTHIMINPIKSKTKCFVWFKSENYRELESYHIISYHIDQSLQSLRFFLFFFVVTGTAWFCGFFFWCFFVLFYFS